MTSINKDDELVLVEEEKYNDSNIDMTQNGNNKFDNNIQSNENNDKDGKFNNTRFNDKDEPILKEENRRFTTYPIKYNDIWKMYKEQLACFWKVEEIDFSKDHEDFEALSKEDKHFLKMIWLTRII